MMHFYTIHEFDINDHNNIFTSNSLLKQIYINQEIQTSF